MREIEVKLRAGMARNGITGAQADTIVRSITAFALYGFPECVVGDTRVIDADTGRWVSIEDVVSARVPVTHTLACDVDLKLQTRRVLAATSSGRRAVLRLRTALGRELAATPEHPLLTMEGWRALGDLRTGDRVAGSSLDALGGMQGPSSGTTLRPSSQTELRETYDLRIEADHNFLANDLVVHNSHAASFALLAYASAYLKTHHPAAFYAALLNNQPMGFYHPATIVRDAERHGQAILPIDVNARTGSAPSSPTVPCGSGFVTSRACGRRSASASRPSAGRFPSPPWTTWRAGARPAARSWRSWPRSARSAVSASSGAHALWEAERGQPSRAARSTRPARDPPVPSPLPAMTPASAWWRTTRAPSLSLGPHPMLFHRERLTRMGVPRGTDLARIAPGAARDRGRRGGGAPAAGHGQGLPFHEPRGRDRAPQLSCSPTSSGASACCW